MPNYRPSIDDIFVTLTADTEPMPTTQVRRIRNMLQLMSYAGAIVKVDSSRYMMANRSVLERIAGGGSVTLKFPLSGCSLQLITYGAPGTGKSDGIERLQCRYPGCGRDRSFDSEGFWPEGSAQG